MLPNRIAGERNNKNRYAGLVEYKKGKEKHPIPGNINVKNRNEKLATAVGNWTRTLSIAGRACWPLH